MSQQTATNPEWFLASRTLDPSRLKKMAVSQMTRQDSQGLTALIHAAQAGNEEAVHFLLAREGNIHGPCNYTALMAAVENNNPSVVHILAAMQAEQRIRQLSVKDLKQIPIKQTYHNYKSGTTALIIATEQQNLQIFNYLESKEASCSDLFPCHIAAFKHLFGAVQSDLQNVERPDIVGRTPLFYAVFRKPTKFDEISLYHQLIQQLIPKTQVFDKYGKTALHYAAECGNVEAVKVLVGWMAGLGVKYISNQYTHGTCAIHMAIVKKQKQVFQILKKYEADCADGEGKTVNNYCQLYQFEDDGTSGEDNDPIQQLLLDVNEVNQDEVIHQLDIKMQINQKSVLKSLVKSLAKVQANYQKATMKSLQNTAILAQTQLDNTQQVVNLISSGIGGVSNVPVDLKLVEVHNDQLKQLQSSVSNELSISSLNHSKVSENQKALTQKLIDYEREKLQLSEQVKKLATELQMVKDRHANQIKNFINLADDTSVGSQGLKAENTTLKSDIQRIKEHNAVEKRQMIEELGLVKSQKAEMIRQNTEFERKISQQEGEILGLTDELTSLRVKIQQKQMTNEQEQNRAALIQERMENMLTRSTVDRTIEQKHSEMSSKYAEEVTLIREQFLVQHQEEMKEALSIVADLQEQGKSKEGQLLQEISRINCEQQQLFDQLKQKNQIIAEQQQRIQILTGQVVQNQAVTGDYVRELDDLQQLVLQKDIQLENCQFQVSKLEQEHRAALDRAELYEHQKVIIQDRLDVLNQEIEMGRDDSFSLSQKLIAVNDELEEVRNKKHLLADEVVELNLRVLAFQEQCEAVGVKGETPEAAVAHLVDRYVRFVENFRKGANAIIQRTNVGMVDV